jgi:hypothetical protein
LEQSGLPCPRISVQFLDPEGLIQPNVAAGLNHTDALVDRPRLVLDERQHGFAEDDVEPVHFEGQVQHVGGPEFDAVLDPLLLGAL